MQKEHKEEEGREEEEEEDDRRRGSEAKATGRERRGAAEGLDACRGGRTTSSRRGAWSRGARTQQELAGSRRRAPWASSLVAEGDGGEGQDRRLGLDLDGGGQALARGVQLAQAGHHLAQDLP